MNYMKNMKYATLLYVQTLQLSLCFKQGDKVFYERDDSHRWRGPEVKIQKTVKLHLFAKVVSTFELRDTEL